MSFTKYAATRLSPSTGKQITDSLGKLLAPIAATRNSLLSSGLIANWLRNRQIPGTHTGQDSIYKPGLTSQFQRYVSQDSINKYHQAIRNSENGASKTRVDYLVNNIVVIMFQACEDYYNSKASDMSKATALACGAAIHEKIDGFMPTEEASKPEIQNTKIAKFGDGNNAAAQVSYFLECQVSHYLNIDNFVKKVLLLAGDKDLQNILEQTILPNPKKQGDTISTISALEKVMNLHSMLCDIVINIDSKDARGR